MSERRDREPRERDRELSQAPWPEDEELPSAEEISAAEALAQATDRVLAGAAPDDEPLPSRDLDAGEFDALAATLGAIHASHHEAELPRARRDALVDEALREAESRQRSRSRTRLVPLLALAATVLLAIGAVLVGLPQLAGQDRGTPERVATTPKTPKQVLPPSQRSRPSNDLIGRPIKDRGLHASRRLDRVFASRMAGYRALRYARWTGQSKAGRTP